MRKNINTERIEGRVYEHDLKIKTVANQSSPNFGKSYIAGKLNVATDEEGLNVLEVVYTYVAPETKSGGVNKTYTALKSIIDEGKTWVVDGPAAATKVQLDTALALNDFVAIDGTMVSQKQNNGGFVTIVSTLRDEKERNTFTTDMFITSATLVEADAERNIPEDYISLRGVVFNFRNDILPVEFVVRNIDGINYFTSKDISGSNPLYTKVWGKIIGKTYEVVRTEESAFGGASVRTYPKKTKEWVVTGTSAVPYDYGDESILTAEDITTAMQNREVYLAGLKKQAEERKAATSVPVTPTPVVNSLANGKTFTF